MRSAADIAEVGCPEPAAALDQSAAEWRQQLGIANDRCDCKTKKPIPFVLATISEITIRISASESESRIPAKICGLAAGRVIRSSLSRPEMP